MLEAVHAGSEEEQRALWDRALSLYAEFVNDNPDHAKAPRARCMMGLLHFRLGHTQQAVDLLRDPELRVQDPVAGLVALRTLAAAYEDLGEFSLAASCYRQALSMTCNYDQDRDYERLSNLYVSLAEHTDNERDRAGFLEMAIKQLDHALQVTGIDPTRRKAELENLRDVLAAKLPAEPASPPDAEASPDAREEGVS